MLEEGYRKKKQKKTWRQRSEQIFPNRVEAEKQTPSEEGRDYLYINRVSENLR